MAHLTSSVHDAIAQRWRLRLALAAGIMVAGAIVATVIAVAYGESLLIAASLWAGAVAVVMARRSVPRTVTASERAQMATTAAWVVTGIVFYIAVPLLLSA